MKKFINAVLTIIMCGLIMLLCVNLSIRTISIKTVTSSVIEEAASNGIEEVLNEAFPEVSSAVIEKVENVVENNEFLNEVAGNLLDQVSASVSNNDQIDINMIMGELSNAIDQNIPVIEETIGQKISTEQVEKIKTKLTSEGGALENKVTSVVEKIQTATPKTKQFIKTYHTLSSLAVKVFCLAGIVLTIVLLGVINKSYFKWTLFSGIALLVSGILVGLFMPLIVGVMESTIGSRVLGMSIDIPVGSLNFAGMICGIIGIILMIIYFVLNYKYPTYKRHYY